MYYLNVMMKDEKYRDALVRVIEAFQRSLEIPDEDIQLSTEVHKAVGGARVAYVAVLPAGDDADKMNAIVATLMGLPSTSSMTAQVYQAIATASMSGDGVTEKELRERFPEAAQGTIQGRIQDLRRKGLISSRDIA